MLSGLRIYLWVRKRTEKGGLRRAMVGLMSFFLPTGQEIVDVGVDLQGRQKPWMKLGQTGFQIRGFNNA